MTSEKGQETPMEKYVRYKNDISLWYQEMDRYGLTSNEAKKLRTIFLKILWSSTKSGTINDDVNG